MVEAIGGAVGAGMRAVGSSIGAGARAAASVGVEAVRTAGPNVLRSIGTVAARVPEHAVKNIGGDLAPKQIGPEVGSAIKSPNIADTLRISRLQDELSVLRLQGLNSASEPKPTYVFIPEEEEDQETDGIVGLILKLISFSAKMVEFGLDTGKDGVNIAKDPRVQRLISQQFSS